MTYLQARKKPITSTTKGILLLCVIAVLAVVLMQWFRPSFFSSIFTTIARPFWRVQLAVQLGSLKTPEGLLQENAYLKRQLDEANFKLQSVKLIEDENVKLRSMMGRATSTPKVLAAVLKLPPAAPYDELIIDAGEDFHFKAGDLVYASGNILIGKILQVMDDTSKVLLFTSPDEKYDVFIGESQAPATAIGRGGGQYQAELPRGAKITEGDYVIAPALETTPFATVTGIISDPAQPFETILFAPPINLYELRWVFVDVK